MTLVFLSMKTFAVGDNLLALENILINLTEKYPVNFEHDKSSVQYDTFTLKRILEVGGYNR
jgi:hypothetical protein